MKPKEWDRVIKEGIKWHKFPTESVLDKEWDILVIFDACRHDVYQKVRGKKIPFIISNASTTGEWFQNTFKGKMCKDIVYISANPFISKPSLLDCRGRQMIGYNPFYELILIEGVDEEIKEGPYTLIPAPHVLTREAVRIQKEYPDKRFILHYMQPHASLVGKKKMTPMTWEPRRMIKHQVLQKAYETLSDARPWEKPKEYKMEMSLYYMGKVDTFIVDEDEIRECYESNMRLVCKEIPKLKKAFKDKKVVVTADHGELLTEYGLLDHIAGVRVKELVEVPWDVI